MSNSIKLNENMLNKIVNHYKKDQDFIDNDNILFKAKNKDYTVLVYKNYTCLFQGKNAEIELNKWTKNQESQLCLFEENSDIKQYEKSHIGSDEVGCGDYFGPIVVSSSYVQEKDIQYLLDIGVKDSKQLNDETIKKIAPLIKERIKTITFILTNKKYNELQNSSNYNLNKIKAYLHNFVLSKIVKETKSKDLVVLDQFCSEENYYKYLKDYKTKDVLENIRFETKAENKYLAVACSSIVARDTFLTEIEKISEEINHKVILGAGEKVDELAIQVINEHGIDFLKNYVKFHFKNTEKILKM